MSVFCLPAAGVRVLRRVTFLLLGFGLAAACHRTPQPRVGKGDAAQVAPGASQAAAPLPFVTAENLLAEAEPLWQRRDEATALRACLTLLERALVQRPGDAALAAKLGRGYFLLGQAHLRPVHDVAGMRQAFERGLLASEQALGESSPPFRAAMDQGGSLDDALGVVDAGGVAALTWYLANLGGLAAAKGNTVALFYGERLRQGLERLISLDEAYFYATPQRFLAIFLAKMPAFAGGSLEAARDHFARALVLAPNYFDNGLSFAQYYALPRRELSLYRDLLEAIDRGDASALAEVAPELRLQQQRARTALTAPGARP